ncbi:sulfatase domain-containing protein [Metarhizium anisopliae]|nr:sulfatase domain-containing protein [Metarhizium anisopliae]
MSNSISTCFAAAALVSFFCETGGEIRWADAVSVAFDAGARKVASSGSGNALIACTAIIVVSFFMQDLLHRAVGAVLHHARDQLDSMLHLTPGTYFAKKLADHNLLLPTVDKQITGCIDLDGLYARKEQCITASCSYSAGYMSGRRFICWCIIGTQLLGCLLCVFLQPNLPYRHAAATLPLSLLSVVRSCILGAADRSDVTWPLPDLVTRLKWESPDGYFKGWAPGTDNEFVSKYRSRVPEWLPESPPSGFHRWESQSKSTSGNTSDNATDDEHAESPDSASDNQHFYNPVNDPLKINNLHGNILPALRDTLGLESVNIRHVVLIQMESMRQELFPLQKESNFHKMVLQSHDESKHDDVNLQLARLTVNAERVTGMSGDFHTADGRRIPPESKEWHDRTEAGLGGLNVIGTHTTCSSSIKSLAAIHCGVWPMPVDWCEESKLQSYQPCLPQIFKLLNMLKNETPSISDYRDHKWYPAFFQSIDDEFDDQNNMDDMIGFEHIVTRQQVDDQVANSGVDEEEVNYFGYAETAIKSHIKDYMKKAIESNQRMFLSHFTSTTHHPWSVPSWFDKTEYMGSARGGLTTSHEDMNNYLNTIRWNDAWVGEVMQLLDDFEISNETLVVFVGDHGQAFREDTKASGTYQNGHVSNFRVPLAFRHPRIPRVQLAVNSTSINILPTVLDLLISSGSLNARDTDAASDIIQDYEGQSLIRPFETTHRGRRAWNFGIVNPGGRFLAMTSADVPWRLVLPWDDSAEYVFTNLEKDPLELDGILNWSLEGLVSDVERHLGADAATWVREAASVARWWGMERKRLWKYH